MSVGAGNSQHSWLTLPASRQPPCSPITAGPLQTAHSVSAVFAPAVSFCPSPPRLVFPCLFPRWQDYSTSVLLLACPCLSFLPDFFSPLSSSLCSGKSDEQLPCCHCLVAWCKGFCLSTSLWDCQPTFSRNSLKSLGTV